MTRSLHTLLIVSALAVAGLGGCGAEPAVPAQLASVTITSALATCALRVPVASPPGSSGHAVAYDAGRGVVLLLTGSGGPGSGAAVLYELHVPSQRWFRLDVDAAAPVPSSRFAPGFAHDHKTGRTVLFGGRTASPQPRDVWEWNGCAWSDRTPAALPANWPSARWGAAMTYDWASERVMLTTGIEAIDFPWEADMADATVFEWDSGAGNFIVRAAAGTAPSNRGGAVAVADRGRKLVYLMTGLQETDSFGSTGDAAVYTWNGATGSWSRSVPSTFPSARAFAAGYHDVAADRIVVTGGLWFAWRWTPDIWSYDPAVDTFSLVAASPADYNRFWSPIAYDDVNARALQFGGSAAGNPEGDGFAGISLHAFSDWFRFDVAQSMSDTRQIASTGDVSLALAKPGTSFSAYRTNPVALDGALSPGEWDDAAMRPFRMCAGVSPGRIYVKNDANDLYLAVVLDNARFRVDSTGVDFLDVFFDNDADGVVAAGDNHWALRGVDGLTVDAFNPNGIAHHSQNDVDHAGTADLTAAIAHSNRVFDGAGTYTAEFRAPLDSSDDDHDFSLKVGSLLGFTFIFAGAGACNDYWPTTSSSSATIVVAGVAAALGAACTTPGDCASGACVDGVCCATDCGGGVTTDCQACSIALGGSIDGICSLIDDTRICRGSSDECDAAELCTGTTPACPVDGVAPAGAACGAEPGLCETAGACDGVSAVCPGPGSVPACFAEAAPPCTGPCDVDLRGGVDSEDGVTVTFPGGVDAVGEMSVEPCSTAAPPPSGYQIVAGSLGQYCWDIEATAVYEPPIIVCIHYPEAIAAGEASFQMVHDNGDGAGYVLVTVSRDPASNVICGVVDSLSPFALVLQLDTTGPVFDGVPDTVKAFATRTHGALVSYTAPTAVDAQDGPRPVTCSPASGTRFPVGQTTVNCTAADGSGNEATASFTVWVTYEAPTDGTFFLTPIRSDGSSVFRIGKPVGVKFRLTGASKNITNLVARFEATKLSGTVRGTADDECDEDGEDDDMLFKYRPGKQLYAYRWKTRGETRGTYRLRADLGDGVVHEITVSLKAQRP